MKNQILMHVSLTHIKTIIFCFCFFGFSIITDGQKTYTQIWNEVDLVRAINDRWVAELDLAGTFSNTPSEPRILKTNIQRNFTLWAHYQLAPRWKLSSFIAYYRNKDVPDIGQYKAPEWRVAVQGRYYFHKIKYSLYTDMRAEVRFIGDTAGVFEDIYRYHQKLKYIQPLNSQVLRGGVVYLFASEEVIIRSKPKETGFKYFDCNLASVAIGYLFTNDIQLELAYVNVFIPRDDHDEIDNAISLTLTVNNLIKKVGKLVSGKPAEPSPDE